MGTASINTAKQATMFDIGRIDYQIKKMLSLGEIMTLIGQDDSISKIEQQGNCPSSMIIHTKTDSIIEDIKFIISSILINLIQSNMNNIMQVLQALGFPTLDDYFNLVINRVNMLYTVLQITKNNFVLVLV